jgi:hypothetical protein
MSCAPVGGSSSRAPPRRDDVPKVPPPHPYTSRRRRRRRRSEAERSASSNPSLYHCHLLLLACADCLTDRGTHPGLRQPIYHGTRTLWTRRLSARKTYVLPANRPSQYALCSLKPCRCVDRSLQHRLSRTIACIITTLAHNDLPYRATHVLRNTSSSASGLSSHPSLPRHVCNCNCDSPGARRLVQHSA